MTGMRLGGIDPSILRELSGVYKPFVKAFKELISNAYDADAETVHVRFSDDLSWVTVTDDGLGMTPFEFRNDFTRIGGGSRRWAGDRTRKGRLRIGSKGIGFLALARYCDRLCVESGAARFYETQVDIPDGTVSFDLADHLGVPIPHELLLPRLTCQVRRAGRGKLEEGKDFHWNKKRTRLSIGKETGPVSVKATVDCSGLRFHAQLDFERLLQLADNADLEKLDDFATIELIEKGEDNTASGTVIKADQLKPFVRRELKAERRKGFVRNIGSRSGIEQFNWNLSRCTPVSYTVPPECPNPAVTELLTSVPQATLSNLIVEHGKSSNSLYRPIYPLESGSPPVPADMLIRVNINEGGMQAVGYLAGFESVIFPAEYRGLSIRIRGVSIGDPGYLGADTILTGASRAALSQISGEIVVTAGLDAVDTLNPGRESFYEESDQYKIFRKRLVGEGERVGGYLGQAIATVIRRSQVRSALADVIGKATMRRRALDDVSSGVTFLIGRGDRISELLQKMVKAKHSHVNGLASAKPLEVGIPPKIGGLTVVKSKSMAEPTFIDYCKEHILIDTTRNEWRWSIVLFNRTFEVILKKGDADLPIAEADMKEGRIYVNWGHPVKQQMDERGFLRTALAWVVAREAADKEPDRMMDLALRLLSYNTQGDG
jgi:hypothetical protein